MHPGLGVHLFSSQPWRGKGTAGQGGAQHRKHGCLGVYYGYIVSPLRDLLKSYPNSSECDLIWRQALYIGNQVEELSEFHRKI